MTRAKNNKRISIHLSQPIAGRVLEGIRALFPRDISRCRGFDSFNISDEEISWRKLADVSVLRDQQDSATGAVGVIFRRRGVI
ncbi:hypothetical protein C5167_036578 [Papaver somniferum]|uniref:Uncharacterized protein n=1 Tax=Papaver somniferum TaxID=3469 RepID=A0A4Y7I895_PAPSO|nr:hypothetical protein C5167_036578 [Papaver somniferum]